jgi:glycosyltransferase involved in cell wall biosynthesis
MERGNSCYRIIMFAPQFAPFGNPESYVNSRLALAFLAAGWEVNIISRDYTHDGYNYGFEWVNPWLPLRNVTFEITYPMGSKVNRARDIALSVIKTGHPIDGCRWASRAIDLAIRLHKNRKYSVILSRSVPAAAHLPAMILKNLTGLPWIANWNDPPVCPLLRHGEINTGLGYFHKRFIRRAATVANLNTFPSDRMKAFISDYVGYGIEKKSLTIPHISLPRKPLKEKRKTDLFTICHAGHLFAERNPEPFLDALARFVAHYNLKDRLQLLVIGSKSEILINLARDYGLEANIKMLGILNYETTVSYLEASDLLLILEAPYEEGIFLPSKFVDYVQTGRPILAVSPSKGTLNDILSSHGGGIAVDCNSVDDIYNALCLLYWKWENGILESEYSSSRLSDIFSPNAIIAKYEKMFNSLGIYTNT